MDTLKNIGKGNRVDKKRISEDVIPANQSELNLVIDKLNEAIAALNAFERATFGLVPYTGATDDVDLGVNRISSGSIGLGRDVIIEEINTGDMKVTTPADKTLYLVESCYRDEYPSEMVVAGGSAAPDEVDGTIGGVQRRLRGFDGGTTEERLSGSFEIPHDYQIGGDIEAHIHWRPYTTGTGVVKWFLDYEYSPPNAAPIAQSTLSVTYNIPSDQQYRHVLSTFGNLPQPSTPFAIGGKIGFNLRRTPSDAADTYSGDALLEQVALHVPVDTLGSRQLYVK
jgi:hypothetical protein